MQPKEPCRRAYRSDMKKAWRVWVWVGTRVKGEGNGEGEGEGEGEGKGEGESEGEGEPARGCGRCPKRSHRCLQIILGCNSLPAQAPTASPREAVRGACRSKRP